MKAYDLLAEAARAVSARADRPATAVVHDSPDARLVIFRIEPGQTGEPHGMRARDEQLVILATIAPRPGTAR